MVATAEEVSDRYDAVAKRNTPELADDPDFAAARKAADRAVAAARSVVAALDKTDMATLRKQMTDVAKTARQVAAAAPHLADDVAAARAQVDQLAGGLASWPPGAQLHDRHRRGQATAPTSYTAGSTGSPPAPATRRRARQLRPARPPRDGSASCSGAAAGPRAADGAGEDPRLRRHPAQRADVLGDPVGLDPRLRSTRPASYGASGSPRTSSALALWVGAMITYMLLRPLNRRHADVRRARLRGWRSRLAARGRGRRGPGDGAVRGGALGLGLVPGTPCATSGLPVLTAVAFAAIVQWSGAGSARPGGWSRSALLMLQLTSSGGTYPVQTTPGVLPGDPPAGCR